MENSGAMKNSVEPIYTEISQDPRLLHVNGRRPEESLFIPEASVFRWFTRLNLRLAKACISRLTKRELVGELNGLRDEGSWASLPQEILDFGKRYGLIGLGLTRDDYVFPLSWVLSRVSSTVLGEVAEVLQPFEDFENRSRWLNRPMAKVVDEGLANFPEKEVIVVRGRENLSGEGRLILQDLGRRLNLTRERARQLEAQFWRKLLGPSLSNKGTSRAKWTTRSVELRHAFINAFLSDFMRGQGRLLAIDTIVEANLRLFCAKCIGLPIAEVPQTNDKVIGAFLSDLTCLSDVSFSMGYEIGDNSFLLLKLGRTLPIAEADLNQLAENVSQAWLKRTTKTKKVSLVMRAIGKPAHYSEVSRRFNSIFPEQMSSDRNIHVILARKRFGVTSTGVRGIYGLEEGQYHGIALQNIARRSRRQVKRK